MFNKMKFFKLMFGLLIAGLAMSGPASANERYGDQKVVYHINYDDPKHQATVLHNIQNNINAVGADHITVKVVLHGNGLSLLLLPKALKTHPKFRTANATSEMQQKIDALKMQGVQFDVCANTLKGKAVDYKKDLYDVDTKDVVPSGVAELVRLQQQGYAYLRP